MPAPLLLPCPLRAAAAALALAAGLAGCAPAGCGSAPPRAPAAEAPAGGRWARCDAGGTPGAALPEDPLEAAVCEAWRAGRADGRALGAEDARVRARRETADGYRLRRVAILLLLGLAGGAAGAAVGALGRGWLDRRRRPGYAAHLLRVAHREANAVRALGRDGDALAAHLAARLEEPLARLEARAQELARRCAPLERRADLAADRAHLEGLHRKLAEVAARLESLHVQVTVWCERLAEAPGEDAAVDAQVAEAVGDLEQALEATP